LISVLHPPRYIHAIIKPTFLRYSVKPVDKRNVSTYFGRNSSSSGFIKCQKKNTTASNFISDVASRSELGPIEMQFWTKVFSKGIVISLRVSCLTPTNLSFWKGVFGLLDFPPKLYMQSTSPSFVLHALPISSYLTSSF
jgi:hypothetical protein